MIRIVFRLIIFMMVLFSVSVGRCWSQSERFKVLVVVSKAKDHQAMISAAYPYFKKLLLDRGFSLTITDDSGQINTKKLEQDAVFVMLHLAPFDISRQEHSALEAYLGGPEPPGNGTGSK